MARCVRIHARDPHRPDSAARPARPTSRSRSACPAAAPAPARPASASSTTCSTCSPATAGWTSTSTSPATCRRARTTRSRTRGSCSARRSTRRSATAAGSSATGTRSCRWTRRARPCAIDISGRPYALLTGFERLPPGDIAGFEHEAAEEFFRAVASAARLTLHIELQAGTNAHHMIEACFKALRPRAARRGLDRPRGDRRAVDQGDADVIAIADYGMGNRRSVEKALAHVGAESVITADHDAIRAAAAVILPGVGAFPEAMRNLERTGLGEVLIERAAAGVPLLGHLPRHAAAVRVHAPSTRARRASASCPATVTRLESPRLPHIGWNLVTFERDVGADRGPRRRRGLLPRALVRLPARGPDRRRRHERVRRALRLRRRARERHGRPVPPREVLPRRAAHAAQLRRSCAAVAVA